MSAQVDAQVCIKYKKGRNTNGYKLDELVPPKGDMVLGTQSPWGSQMLVLGIDPGQTGGISAVKFLNGKTPTLLKAMRTPVLFFKKKKVIDVASIMIELQDLAIDIAIIEQVHAMPKQGVSSSFQFGRSYGAAEACCQLLAPKVEYVSPAVWKKAMGLGSEKQSSLDMAKLTFGRNELWNVKANDGIAEAALLCIYLVDKFNKVD